eukprot:scaffold74117_cov61-Phaeocystis_antarctica.AAC.4
MSLPSHSSWSAVCADCQRWADIVRAGAFSSKTWRPGRNNADAAQSWFWLISNTYFIHKNG